MVTFTFTLGDRIAQSTPYSVGFGPANVIQTFANGVQDRIILDVSEFATPSGFINEELWLYADTPGYNGNATVQDELILSGLPTGWTYTLRDTQFGTTAPNGNFYTAAQWNALGFKYLMLYDGNGNQQTGLNQIWILGIDGNLTVCFTGAGTRRVVDGVETFGGTRIRMADGSERLIEGIKEGDLVETADHGAQPVRWLGKTKYDADYFEQFPQSRPIRFLPGALGNKEEILVSPQHCMLLTGDWAEAITGSREDRLVPAKALINDTTIFVDREVSEVCYYHILFDNHEIIKANNAWSESFNPGLHTMRAIDEATRVELVNFFPELDFSTDYARPPARVVMRPGQLRQLQKKQAKQAQKVVVSGL